MINEGNAIKDCPSTRVHHAISGGICSKGMLLRLARNNSAAVGSFSFPDGTIENENRYSSLPSLDYIPYLSYFRLLGTRLAKTESEQGAWIFGQ